MILIIRTPRAAVCDRNQLLYDFLSLCFSRLQYNKRACFCSRVRNNIAQLTAERTRYARNYLETLLSRPTLSLVDENKDYRISNEEIRGQLFDISVMITAHAPCHVISNHIVCIPNAKFVYRLLTLYILWVFCDDYE